MGVLPDLLAAKSDRGVFGLGLALATFRIQAVEAFGNILSQLPFRERAKFVVGAIFSVPFWKIPMAISGATISYTWIMLLRGYLELKDRYFS